MIGVLLMVLCVAAIIYMMVKFYKSFAWHNQGVGERDGRAEYARIQREQPDSAEARQSEPEFVRNYVASRPGIGRYIAGAILLMLIGIPAACTVGVMSTIH